MPEMPPEQKTALEKLNERLYHPEISEQSAQQGGQTFQEPTLPVQQARPAEHWQAPPPPPPRRQKKKISLAVWFLIAALVFALLAAGASALFLTYGGRLVSSDKLDVTVAAPATLASGTAVPITITVENHNPAAITNTDLEVDFPDGTRAADDVTQPLVRYTDTFGTIPAGGTGTRTVQAVLFGSVNQAVTIPITITYNTANSNAQFTKQQQYTFTVTSSPLSINAQTVGSAASGQPFTVQLQVRSNATTVLNDIAVDAEYPAGFTPQGSASTTGPFFTIGTLQPGEEKDLAVTGILTGTASDTRDFNFTVGTAKSDGAPELDIPYASTQSEIAVTAPFLSASLQLNHDDTDPLVVNPGDQIQGLVSWGDTLNSGIGNAQVAVTMSGNALNTSEVTAPTGYYDSTHNAIVYSSQTQPQLLHLNAGDSGTGSFTLGLKTGTALSSLRNPTIQFTISVAGTPDNTHVSQSIATALTRTIEVATDLELSSSIVHSTGPFKNSGSWPPVPNQPTTYTVELKATNTTNPVGGATATMILPSYITFTNSVSPSDGSITYDSTSRTVTWKPGSIDAGSSAQAAFQISFTPSSSQVGTSPVLVGNQTFTATDRFTQTQVGNTAAALTTQATADPAYINNDGTVAGQ